MRRFSQIQAYMNTIANSVINIENILFLDNKNLLHDIKNSFTRPRSPAWRQLCPRLMNIPNTHYVLGKTIYSFILIIIIWHQLPTQEILNISYLLLGHLNHHQMMDEKSIQTHTTLRNLTTNTHFILTFSIPMSLSKCQRLAIDIYLYIK